MRLRPEVSATFASAALDPKTPADELCRIVEWAGARNVDPWLASAVALNPNAPPNLLARLFHCYPSLVLRNPSLLLLLLEDPDFLNRVSPSTLKRQLRQQSVARHILSFLATHQDPAVAEAARYHVDYAGEATGGWWAELREILRDHCTDANAGAILELVELGLAPAILVEAVAASGRPGALRAAMAGASRLAALNGHAALVHEAAGSTRAGRLGKPVREVAPTALSRLARGDAWSRLLAARHPNTPPETLCSLATDPLPAVRLRVARNPSTPASDRELLFQDSDERVRRAARRRTERVAGGPLQSTSKPDALPVKLPAHQAYSACEPSVAGSPAGAYPPLTSIGVERRVALAAESPLPRELYERLASDPQVEVRSRLAGNPGLPGSVIERLLYDPDPRVALALFSGSWLRVEGLCQRAPGRIRQLLSLDSSGSPETACAITHLLEVLMRSGSPNAAKLVALHPLTPLSCLLEMAGRFDFEFRRVVARRADLPFEVQAALRETALNQYFPTREPLLQFVYILQMPIRSFDPEEFLSSTEWLERLAAVLNPVTPVVALSVAAEDTNRFVRAAARARITAG